MYISSYIFICIYIHVHIYIYFLYICTCLHFNRAPATLLRRISTTSTRFKRTCVPANSHCSATHYKTLHHAAAPDGLRRKDSGEPEMSGAATYCNVLPHTPTHCCTLQHAVVCNCIWRGGWEHQRLVKRWYVLQHIATHCNTLLRTATYYNARQRFVASYEVKKRRALEMGSRPYTLQCIMLTLQHTATPCNTLQHTAIHCNTLQYTAICCITLQQRGLIEHHW